MHLQCTSKTYDEASDERKDGMFKGYPRVLISMKIKRKDRDLESVSVLKQLVFKLQKPSFLVLTIADPKSQGVHPKVTRVSVNPTRTTGRGHLQERA